MAKTVVIVPSDKGILVDGKHLTHTGFEQLDLCRLSDHLKPQTCIHAVRYDEALGYAVIQWTPPPQTMLTKEQFLELFGDCVEDHEDWFMHDEAERMEWERQDREQTARIEAAKKVLIKDQV